jgi:signal transduction histidine kinase
MFTTNTIFIVASLVLFSFVMVVTTLYDLSKDKSARLWVLGTVSIAIGYLLIAFRFALPEWWFFGLSNTCTFLGVSLTFMALGQLLFNYHRPVFPIAILAVIWGLGLSLLLNSAYEGWIVAVVGFFWGSLHLYFAYQLVKLSKVQDISIKILLVICTLIALSWIVRIVAGTHNGFTLISSNVSQNILFVLLNIMLSTVRQLMYLILRVSADSSERKQLLELNEEKNKLITSLLKVNKTVATNALSATVAHEINQPLTAIILTTHTAATLLDDTPMDKERLKNELACIQQEASRAADTVKTLRLIFQEKDVVSEPCDLQDLVKFVVNLSRYDFNKKGIDIDLNFHAPCWINASSSEIRQVLINIFSNAVDALTDVNNTDKRIRVSMYQIHQQVKLEITDNGQGISSKHQSTIFDLLQTNKPAGSGLGLWLCRILLARHNGTIEHSTPEEGGATFTILLPAISDATWQHNAALH